MGYFVKNRQLQSGSSSIVVPSGDSADRPVVPVFGSFRYNTDIGTLEFFNGTVFKQVGLGGELNVDVYSATGDGSTLTFSIGNTTAISANDQVIVFVGSIYQAPTTAYAITGGGYDITFTSAPPSGEPINIIRNLVAPATP
jgi:hypothetical protein